MRAQGAGLDARVSGAIDVELWQKFVFIVGVSGATAYFRSTIGAVRSNYDTGRFLVRLVEETVAVGHAEAIALPPDQVERTMALIAGLPEGMHGSMRDDLERGSRLPSYLHTTLNVALQSFEALSTIASNTGPVSVGDRLITVRTSPVAV